MQTEQQQLLYLSLTLGLPGIRRKVNVNKVRIDADQRLIRVTKKIMDSATYREIVSLDGNVRRWLMARSLPVPALKAGVYAVPVGLVTSVEEKLAEFSEKRDALVEQFVQEYPQRIEEAKVRLRSNFSPDDYPGTLVLQDAFRIHTRYVSFDVPTALKEVSGEIFAREREKAARAWQDTLEAWTVLLRTSMADLVNHMVERLSMNADGKPRVFKDSLVSNLRDFLGTFDARNVADDADLKELAEKARSLLSRDVTPERLREDSRFREAVAVGFAKIKEKLDTMIVERPKRRITFGDE